MVELNPGDIFADRYEILKVLGVGGIGTVYKGRQLDMDRIVALKLLHATIAEDQEFKIRFQREAQALNKLVHANVVTIYHLGIAESGAPYIAMEYIEGNSLRVDLLNNGKLPTQRALKIIRDTANALEYVHENGIVHRDLKPDNIVLVNQPEKDTVKLIDFGLAKYSDEKSQKLTSTGTLIGTVHYMSPEQCAGRRADHRSDIYSLCLCLYEMLTGEMPFNADTPMGIMYQHLNNAAPEIKARQTEKFAPSINELLMKGLAKDPSKRFQRMSELAQFADEINNELETNNSSSSRRSGPSKAAIISTCVSLAIFAAIGISYYMMKTANTHDGVSNSNISQKKDSLSSGKMQRFTENIIGSEMFRGSRQKAKEMAESTLKFSNLSNYQRGRILLQLGDLSANYAPINCYMNASNVLKNLPSAKGERFCALYHMANCLRNIGLPKQAIKAFKIVLDEVEKNGIPVHKRDIYTLDRMKHKAALLYLASTLTDISSKDEALKYLKKLEPLLDAEDETEAYGPFCKEALRIDKDELAKKQINLAEEAMPQTEISRFCVMFQRLELARQSADRAANATHTVDGHTPARAVAVGTAVGRVDIERGDFAKARKELDLTDLMSQCSRQERLNDLPLVRTLMSISGLPIDALQALVELPPPNSAIAPKGSAWTYEQALDHALQILQFRIRVTAKAIPKATVLPALDSSKLPEIQTEAIRQIFQLIKTKRLSQEEKATLYFLLYEIDEGNQISALVRSEEEVLADGEKRISRPLRLQILSNYAYVMLRENLPTQAQKAWELVYKDVKAHEMPEFESLIDKDFYSKTLGGLAEIYAQCNKIAQAQAIISEKQFPLQASTAVFKVLLKLDRMDLAKAMFQTCDTETHVRSLIKSAFQQHSKVAIEYGIERARELAAREQKPNDRLYMTAKNSLAEAFLNLEFDNLRAATEIINSVARIDITSLEESKQDELRNETAACVFLLGNPTVAQKILAGEPLK